MDTFNNANEIQLHMPMDSPFGPSDNFLFLGAMATTSGLLVLAVVSNLRLLRLFTVNLHQSLLFADTGVLLHLPKS